MAVGDNNLFAGTKDRGVFLSTDNGTSWTAVNNGLTGNDVSSLAAYNGNLFAGTGIGVSLSTNNGTTWNAINTGLPKDTIDTTLYTKSIFFLAVHDTMVFAGTEDGVFCTTNNGTSWTAVNDGLMDYVLCFAANDSNIFVGTDNKGVWRQPLSDISTATKPQNSLPEQFSFNLLTRNLSNRSVTISFSLPRSGQVKLKVYNLSGHLITTLLDKPIAAGPHNVSWDTRNVASGCYMVRMQAGANTQVKAIPLFR